MDGKVKMSDITGIQWKPFLKSHPDERPSNSEISLNNVNLNIDVLIPTPA